MAPGSADEPQSKAFEHLERKKTFGQLFPQLFLFPLILVVVGVLVYLFFHATLKDARQVDEIIADLESGGQASRRQDAYALALDARDLVAKGDRYSPEVTRKLLRLLDRFQDDPEGRRFITLAAGRAGDPELTLEPMSRLAIDPAASPEIRIEAVCALGLSRSPRAVETLKKVIDENAGPDGWETRRYALAGLVEIGDESAIPYLRRGLEDSRREIQWYSAYGLAATFRDPSGKEILEKLVNWDYLDQLRGDRARGLEPLEKELNMMFALYGLYRLEGAGVAALLKEKARDPRSVKVRDVANRLLSGKDVKLSAIPQSL
jgi:HEAT repeat protein